MTSLRDVDELWPVQSSRTVFEGARVGVRRDTLAPLNIGDEPFDREVVTHPGAVGVVALDEQGRVLVIRQYRHAAGKRMIELPAGLLDVMGETALEAAQRELREEGLLEAATWTLLLTYQPSAGTSEEVIVVYLAEGVTPTSAPEGFEAVHEEASLTREWVVLDQLVKAVLAGDVSNGLTIAGSLAAHIVRGAKELD